MSRSLVRSFGRAEMYAAVKPINQRVVSVEPAVSEHCVGRGVQVGHVERDGHAITCREGDGDLRNGGDGLS